MKIESPLAKKPVLKLEISVLRKLEGLPFFPKFIACGRFVPPTKKTEMINEDTIHSYVVMQLLGPRYNHDLKA